MEEEERGWGWGKGGKGLGSTRSLEGPSYGNSPLERRS